MPDYVLSCDSTVDLTAEVLRELDLVYVPYHFYLDDVPFREDLGQTLSPTEFYQKMRQGAVARTAQVNISEYLEYFEALLQQGKDILHVCFSSGLSGSYGSAVSAAQMAMQNHPDRRVRVADSLCASSGYGLLMDKLSCLRSSGMDMDALADWAEDNRLRLNHWFYSTDLTYYVRGGRVSKTSGLFGGLLGICPLLHMDNAGKLVPMARVRGKKRVMAELIKRMEDAVPESYSEKCWLCHSDCYEDAAALAEIVKSKFPHLPQPPRIFDIGPTVGSHAGPGTLALFFWGEKR